MTENLVLNGKINNTVKNRELIYRHFSPKMYPICLRFARNKMEADDILQESFIRIFRKLDDFRNEGSFEGWVRKTFVNTAINYFKKNKRINNHYELSEINEPESVCENAFDILSQEELLDLIQNLPAGYRTVFNLNVIEGYTHKEIGEMLNISDNTSKSQLARAKQVLREKIHLMVREKVKVPFGDLKLIRNTKNTGEALLKAG
ncbi:MAG: sigma-70 family RNA polymerase sigma factor [Bacteroidales bacterium]|nr:sigma-70 family RNA polymerase sigma factor [Bacteroidales bacterium]